MIIFKIRLKKREGIQVKKKLGISYLHHQKSSYGYENRTGLCKILALSEAGVEDV